MRFEWDLNKAEFNFQKHGLTFDDAIGVFADPHVLIEEDPFPLEFRKRALGEVDGLVLFVIFTLRADETIRLISARRASRNERSKYETRRSK